MIARPQYEDAPNGHGSASPDGDDVFVLPTSVAQRGFWYLDQLEPGNPAYNIAVRFRLQGKLRIAELERALNEIVRRHESLRTVIAVVDGVPMQVVAPHTSIPLHHDDLRSGPEKNRRDKAESIAAEEARIQFDLAKGPLIRARLLCLDAVEHILILTIHHIVSDGWSIGIFVQELGALYDAYCHGRASPLPGLALQYGDFAIWQDQWLQSSNLTDQIGYWTRQLSNLPLLEIRTDRPRPSNQTFRGHIDSILLPREITDDLIVLANREKATPFMVMLAAVQLLLHRCTGQDDIFVGSVLAGRHRVELESLIGLFINPLVFRTNCSGDPPFLELLARVREIVLQAFANQDVPFERVVEAVQPKRDPSRHPVFQINFLFQRDFVHPFQASGVTLTPIPSVSAGSIYDLNIFMVERAEGWRASCEYNTDLYDSATIRGLLGQFQCLLTGIAAAPICPLSELPLTSAASPEPQTWASSQHTGLNGQSSLPSGLVSHSYVAPRDPVEFGLAELWKRLLKVNDVSVTADFFDSGGHSLLAARLVAEIEKAFSKKLSLATFLEAPTIEALAARLRAENPMELSDRVYAIQAAGSRPPWVVVTSQPHLYRRLAHHLSPDQPVLGLTSPELAALPERFTVKDIAANLIEALRLSYRTARTISAAGASQAPSHTKWPSNSGNKARRWPCWRCWTPTARCTCESFAPCGPTRSTHFSFSRSSSTISRSSQSSLYRDCCLTCAAASMLMSNAGGK